MIPVETIYQIHQQSQKELYQAAEKERMIKEILRGRSNERSFRLKFAVWFGALFQDKTPVHQVSGQI